MLVGRVAVARARARVSTNLPTPPAELRCVVEDYLTPEEIDEIRRTTELPIGCNDFEAEWRFRAMVHARRKFMAAREAFFAEHAVAPTDEGKVWPHGRPVWRDGYGTDYPRKQTRRRGAPVATAVN